MPGIAQLLNAFRDDISERRGRAWRRLLTVFGVIKISAFAAAIALLALVITHTAPGFLGGATTRSLFSNVFEVVFIFQMADFAAATAFALPFGFQAPTAALARALVDAAAARDASLTQVIEVAADAGSEPLADGGTIGPLGRPMRDLQVDAAIYVLVILVGVAMVGGGALMLLVSVQAFAMHGQPPVDLEVSLFAFPCSLIVLGVLGVTSAFILWRFTRQEHAPMSAQIDADGITFTRVGGLRRRLRWSDTRSLARLTFLDSSWRTHEVFILSDARHDYIWEAVYPQLGATINVNASEEAWRVAAHRLVEQATQRTGLPLLDLTTTVLHVATSAAHGERNIWDLPARAEKIARQRGDAALAHNIQSWRRRAMGALAARFLRSGVNVRRLAPAQCDDALLLARNLLPYYTEQLTQAPRAWRLAQMYLASEFVFQFAVVVLAVLNTFLYIVWPFS